MTNPDRYFANTPCGACKRKGTIVGSVKRGALVTHVCPGCALQLLKKGEDVKLWISTPNN